VEDPIASADTARRADRAVPESAAVVIGCSNCSYFVVGEVSFGIVSKILPI
jgi:hypothetical protein